MMGTCLGRRLLKPASWGKAIGSEVEVEDSDGTDDDCSEYLEAGAKRLAKKGR